MEQISYEPELDAVFAALAGPTRRAIRPACPMAVRPWANWASRLRCRSPWLARVDGTRFDWSLVRPGVETKVHAFDPVPGGLWLHEMIMGEMVAELG
ncbi:MAG: hypothetical protein AAF222_00680 [Pseudomonadota bacterium]